MGKYLVESYEQALRENAALREENERLTAANKARAEYLTTRRAGNDVDRYVNLAETKIEELRARLAEAERNENAAMVKIDRLEDQVLRLSTLVDTERSLHDAKLAEAEARLAEATELLSRAEDDLGQWEDIHGNDSETTRLRLEIMGFRAADSAPAAQVCPECNGTGFFKFGADHDPAGQPCNACSSTHRENERE